MNVNEVRAALTGPVGSVRTPFHRDGSIDYDGLRNIIEFNIQAGSKTVLLTAGDSLYTMLTDEEIAEVTKVTVEHTRGRAMVVAADRYFATPKAIEFAKYCRDIKVDVLMVLPPDWGGSATPETFTEHYAAVAEHISVMMVTNCFIPRGEAFGLKTVKLVLESVPGVVAVKEDFRGAFARKMALMVHDHWAVFSGGQKQNHLDMHPYGCDGYLSTQICFQPRIAHEYWKAIETNEIPKAAGIIRDFDIPFFDYLIPMQGGFDAGLRGMIEVFGLAQRWRRKPLYSLSDAELDQLRAFCRKMSLL